MAQTAQATEISEQAEDRLWAEYLGARTLLHDSYLLEDKFWHEYVQTGLHDADVQETWRMCADKSRELRGRVNDARRAWERVAFPLYNLAFLLNDEDEE